MEHSRDYFFPRDCCVHSSRVNALINQNFQISSRHGWEEESFRTTPFPSRPWANKQKSNKWKVFFFEELAKTESDFKVNILRRQIKVFCVRESTKNLFSKKSRRTFGVKRLLGKRNNIPSILSKDSQTQLLEIEIFIRKWILFMPYKYKFKS